MTPSFHDRCDVPRDPAAVARLLVVVLGVLVLEAPDGVA